MPEPDFEQIARTIAEDTGIGRLGEWDEDDPKRVITAVAEQLRQVWNARGAADAKAVEHAALYADSTDTVLLPIAKACWKAVKGLDR